MLEEDHEIEVGREHTEPGSRRIWSDESAVLHFGLDKVRIAWILERTASLYTIPDFSNAKNLNK